MIKKLPSIEKRNPDYIIFCRENRNQVKSDLVKEGIECTPENIIEKLLNMWKDSLRPEITTIEENKDTSPPKKPKSTYLFFCAEYRSKVKNDLAKEGLPSTGKDVMRQLGVVWREFQTEYPDNFALLEEKSKEDKKRYDEEMSLYSPPSDNESLSPNNEKPKSKKPKDDNKPKKPTSTYLFFCAEYRDQVKNDLAKEGLPSTGKDVIKQLGVLWREFQKDQPDKLIMLEEKSKEDKKRYDEEMSLYSPPPNLETEVPEKKTLKKQKPPVPKSYKVDEVDDKERVSFFRTNFKKAEKLVKEENPNLTKEEYKKLAIDILASMWIDEKSKSSS